MLYLFESQWYLITFTFKVLVWNTWWDVFFSVCFFHIHWICSTRTSTTHLESKKRKLQKVIGQSFSQPCSIWSSLQTAQGFLINMQGDSAPPKTTKENKPLIYLATTGLKVTYFFPQIIIHLRPERTASPVLNITFHCLLNCLRLVSPSVHIHGRIIAGHLGSGAKRNKTWTPPLWHLRVAETALPLGEINYFSNRLLCGTLNDIRHSNPPRRLKTHFPGGIPLLKRRLQKCW